VTGCAPIPSLLATAGVHHHLVREGARNRAALVIESGDAREVHHLALLIGYGAGAVNPYLAFETLDDMIRIGMLPGLTRDKAVRNYIKALNKGVLKVMSKMGISTLQSYRGAQIFEAVGLDKDFVDRYFTWTASASPRRPGRHPRKVRAGTRVLKAWSARIDWGGHFQWRRRRSTCSTRYRASFSRHGHQLLRRESSRLDTASVWPRCEGSSS
jgi:glutamate synthase domain-containing protein 2